MQKRVLCFLLILTLVLLCGCGNQASGPDAPAESLPTAAPTQAPVGPAAQAVEKLLSPYRGEIDRVSAQAGGGSACGVPAQVLAQFARDAQTANARAEEGRWVFSVEETGDHSYESAAMDLYRSDPSLLSATPDPGDETPQDHQLMGDYQVAGGGLFVRTRSYDAAADLTDGHAEFTDTLNGETTGHELFFFAVRDGKIYFVDAAMILTAGLDGLEDHGKYLVAAGYISADGLDVIEYETDGAGSLPAPETLDMAELLSSVSPLTRVQDAHGRVSVSP